ncbi:alpha/beta hydrolase [Sphingobium nicotianae]|uniref:Alpha/beta hydrolase n=1 Tax=Sphingobium nicotianae TaxID=2782607 RepID=A0A9X1DG47_9SPHN|nr:alpha/beta hydrolase [Sphingobium nicotianae]MBT2189261.1 alpha/beta hydrolase [Sphingobium nicotianae]
MAAPFIRPDAAAFLASSNDSAIPPLETLSVHDARVLMRAMGIDADLPAVRLPVCRSFKVKRPVGDIALRLYDRRRSRGAGPLILFFHGGGFVIGDLESHNSFCTWLADRFDLPVLAVDYRLSPEHPFPAAPEDAEAIARWAATGPRQLGEGVTALVTCGDDVGGKLAILVAQRLAEIPASVPVTAQLAIYPRIGAAIEWPLVRTVGECFLVTRKAVAWFNDCYGASGDNRRHNCLKGSVPVKTPLLVMTAGLDPLRGQGVAYAAYAREQGAQVVHLEAHGMAHGFVNLRKLLPSSQGDLENLVTAAKKMLGL